MSGPTEFTLESVRQYMLAQDGRVTNHELVKYFKAWLTHPTEKESARQRFKEYVNTLATIRQENGEKYLVLKKRFYPNFEEDSAPSLLDEVMGALPPSSSYPQQMQQQQPSRRALPPTPSSTLLPQPYHRPPPSTPSDLGLPIQTSPAGSSASSYYTPSQSQRSSYASMPRAPSTDPVEGRVQPPPYRPPPGEPSAHHQPGLPPSTSYRQLPPPPVQQGGGPHHYASRPLPQPPPSDVGLPVPHAAPGARQPYSRQMSGGSLPQHHAPPHSRPSYPPQDAISMMQQQQFAAPPGGMYTNPMQQQHLSMQMSDAHPPPPPLPRRNGPQGEQFHSLQHPGSSPMHFNPHVSPPPLPLPQQPPHSHLMQQQHQQQQAAKRTMSTSSNASSNASSRGQAPPQPQSWNRPGSKEATPPPPLPSRSRNSQSGSEAPSSSRSSLAATPGCSAVQSGERSAASSSPQDEVDGSGANSPEDDAKRRKQEEEEEEERMRLENEKISVKERTRTFNRMASEVDVASIDAALSNAPSAANGTHSSSQRKASSSGRKASSSSSVSSAVKRRNSRAAAVSSDRAHRAPSAGKDDSKSDDSSSICTIDQNSKAWMIRSAQGDYHAMMKMLREDPRLSKHRDFTSGFTALHWAAKHGNLDMVKLLAGSYHVDVNVKSHGGYTPLHLACQFGHQEVFDLLVKAYGAEPRIRDNHGKTPRQYMVTASSEHAAGLTLSSDTFRQLKDRRRSRRQASEKNPGILRFGSLSVRVKKTTEAFNNYFGSERKHSWGSNQEGGGGGGGGGGGQLMEQRKHSWGPSSSSTSASDLVISAPIPIAGAGPDLGGNKVIDLDSRMMPPPPAPQTGGASKMGSIKKRKGSKRSNSDHASKVKSAPSTPTASSPLKEQAGTRSDESDSEFGFDAQWSMPRI